MSCTRDLHNSIHITRAISPQTQTNADTALVSQIADTAGYESLELVIATGGLTDADATFVVLIEDGDDSDLVDDGAAVADAYLLGTEAGASFQFGDDNQIRKIGYVGSKRYVRATITPTGNNSGAAPLSAVWVQGHPRRKPTATLVDA